MVSIKMHMFAMEKAFRRLISYDCKNVVLPSLQQPLLCKKHNTGPRQYSGGGKYSKSNRKQQQERGRLPSRAFPGSRWAESGCRPGLLSPPLPGLAALRGGQSRAAAALGSTGGAERPRPGGAGTAREPSPCRVSRGGRADLPRTPAPRVLSAAGEGAGRGCGKAREERSRDGSRFSPLPGGSARGTVRGAELLCLLDAAALVRRAPVGRGQPGPPVSGPARAGGALPAPGPRCSARAEPAPLVPRRTAPGGATGPARTTAAPRAPCSPVAGGPGEARARPAFSSAPSLLSPAPGGW